MPIDVLNTWCIYGPISKTQNPPLRNVSGAVFRCKFVFCYACGLPTGRQDETMEEGSELCHCYNTIQAAQQHAHQHQ
jgi:hypothetical protein